MNLVRFERFLLLFPKGFNFDAMLDEVNKGVDLKVVDVDEDGLEVDVDGDIGGVGI